MNYYRLRLSEWRNKYYTGEKKPTLATLKRRIDKGILPGSNAAGEYIVTCTATYDPIKPPDAPAPPKPTGNALADAILKRHQQRETAEA